MTHHFISRMWFGTCPNNVLAAITFLTDRCQCFKPGFNTCRILKTYWRRRVTAKCSATSCISTCHHNSRIICDAMLNSWMSLSHPFHSFTLFLDCLNNTPVKIIRSSHINKYRLIHLYHPALTLLPTYLTQNPTAFSGKITISRANSPSLRKNVITFATKTGYFVR